VEARSWKCKHPKTNGNVYTLSLTLAATRPSIFRKNRGLYGKLTIEKMLATKTIPPYEFNISAVSADNTAELCADLLDILRDKVTNPQLVNLTVRIYNEYKREEKAFSLAQLFWPTASEKISSTLSEFLKWGGSSCIVNSDLEIQDHRGLPFRSTI